MDGEDFILRRPPLDRPASQDDDLTHVPVCCLPLVAEILVQFMSDVMLGNLTTAGLGFSALINP